MYCFTTRQYKLPLHGISNNSRTLQYVVVVHILKPPISESFRPCLAMTLSNSMFWTKSERLHQNAIIFLFYKIISLVIWIPMLGTRLLCILNTLHYYCSDHQSSTITYISKDKSLLPNNSRYIIYLLLKAKMPFVASRDACWIFLYMLLSHTQVRHARLSQGSQIVSFPLATR